MQSPGNEWEDVRAGVGQLEYTFVINGVSYGPEAEVSHKVDGGLFSEFGIGNAMCATLNLTLYSDDIPRGAKIERKVRVITDTTVTDWIPRGTFWINRRADDDGLWTIEAFDAMRKADKVWEPDQSLVFPMPMTEAVEIIAALMGVEIDNRTFELLNAAYTVDYPTSEQTLRQTLGWIAAAHGGNFIISDAGALRLVVATGQLNPFGARYHEVYQDLVSFSNNGKFKPISRVTLFIDDEHCLTAGDDTGMELVADCPYATEENQMAENILYELEGYEYQAFDAEAACISPTVELGDFVLFDGMLGIIAKISDDGGWYPDISSPGEAELEDEYPFEGPWTQQFNRKIAETRSLIGKKSDEIWAEIEGVENAFSEVELKVDNFSARIGDAEGNIAQLELAVDSFSVDLDSIELRLDAVEGLTVTDDEGTTRIKGSSIETETLYVKAANVTGTITADALVANSDIYSPNIYANVFSIHPEEDSLGNLDDGGEFNLYGSWDNEEFHFLRIFADPGDLSPRLYFESPSGVPARWNFSHTYFYGIVDFEYADEIRGLSPTAVFA